jgi:hypothetical protein
MLVCNCTLPYTNPGACKNCQVYINYYKNQDFVFDREFNKLDEDWNIDEFLRNYKDIKFVPDTNKKPKKQEDYQQEFEDRIKELKQEIDNHADALLEERDKDAKNTEDLDEKETEESGIDTDINYHQVILPRKTKKTITKYDANGQLLGTEIVIEEDITNEIPDAKITWTTTNGTTDNTEHTNGLVDNSTLINHDHRVIDHTAINSYIDSVTYHSPNEIF